ncbi:MAG: sigma-54-dependent Fis family transcriptional regulator [Pseudobdellovibrionaceae bacterium]|nr:MAG: sigma-54-dependent Fis family transcriptional regulator [Pseudobdellovibrionaceae bacterium]
MKPKILIVDDEQSVHGSFLLAYRGSEVESMAEFEFAFSYDEAIEKFKADPFNYCVAFIDYQFEEKNEIHAVGHLLAKKLKDINPCVTTIIMSGEDSQEALKDWLGSGVDKFLFKPLSNEVIRAISENAIESYNHNLLEEQTNKYTSKEQKLVGLAGKSENIKQVSKLAIKYASCDQPALILGETGTGKELIARAIHDNSQRASRAFVVVNCAAITNTLFESELFGHVKGSFTDAKEDKPGKFRQADGGTIFLDEIHHLNLEQQASLLRVLQEKQVQPVGGKNPIPVDFRLIVAGKPNLRELSENGEFLPDLYFRIKHLDLTILPLRERPEDILPTIAYTQNKIEANKGIYKKIMKPTLDKLVSYNWPGNVRELIGEIERLYVVVDKSIIKESDLPKHILEQKSFSYYSSSDDDLITLEDLELMHKNQQMALIIKAMKLSNYNVAKAGRILGVSRTTLSSKLKALGLQGKKGTMMELILNNLLGGKKEDSRYESRNSYSYFNTSHV